MNNTLSFQASSNAEHPKKVVTKKDRRLQVAKLSIIIFISLATVALTIFDVIQTAMAFQESKKLADRIQGSVDVALVIHDLQKERGMTTLQMGSNRLNFTEERRNLSAMRHETNKSITTLETRQNSVFDLLSGGAKAFRSDLENFRQKIDSGESNYVENLNTYSQWIRTLISILTTYTEFGNFNEYANLFFAYEMIILSKEEAGLERALGGLKFTQGPNFNVSSTIWYNEKRVLAKNYLKIGFLFSNESENFYNMIFSNTSNLMKKLEEKRTILSVDLLNTSSERKAYEWFDLMTKYNSLMLELQIQQADLLKAKVESKLAEGTNQLVIRSLLLGFTVIVVPLIVVSLARVQKSFYEYTLSLFDKVGLEQARTDFLMRENARHVESKYPTNVQDRFRDALSGAPTSLKS